MFTFKIVPDGGTAFEVFADSRDVSLWERTTKGNPTLAKLQDNAAMSDFEVISYNAARRTGVYGGSLNEWRESCAIEIVDDPDEDAAGSSDPTQTGR